MPFRTQYAEDTGLHANPFPVNPSARIQGYFTTARIGGIAAGFATTLWRRHLARVYEDLDALPVDQAEYDKFVVATALAIATTLAEAGRGGFGVAQKILNLFMKDLWALDLLPISRDHLLHAPVDRGTLALVPPCPQTWTAWTKVHAGTHDAPQITDYLRIQTALREKLSRQINQPHPPPYATVIEMDQYHWHCSKATESL